MAVVAGTVRLWLRNRVRLQGYFNKLNPPFKWASAKLTVLPRAEGIECFIDDQTSNLALFKLFKAL